MVLRWCALIWVDLLCVLLVFCVGLVYVCCVCLWLVLLLRACGCYYVCVRVNAFGVLYCVVLFWCVVFCVVACCVVLLWCGCYMRGVFVVVRIVLCCCVCCCVCVCLRCLMCDRVVVVFCCVCYVVCWLVFVGCCCVL